MTEKTEKQMLEDAARLLTEEEMQRFLNVNAMEKSIQICADKILAANPWNKVLTFPQMNGSVKVVDRGQNWEFLVLANGDIHTLLSAEEDRHECFEEEEPLSPLDDTEEARIAAAESAQWTQDNDPDERY
tara:strand:+ start:543 stop:932 length:390 start_codon:yes stop_codon:yes gene_type:complete